MMFSTWIPKQLQPYMQIEWVKLGAHDAKEKDT